MIRNKTFFIAGLLLATLVIVLDQLSKWWLFDGLNMDIRPPVAVGDFFNFVLVWNHGISFGMFSGHRAPLILIVMALVIVVVLLRWLVSADDKAATASIGLIIGGALGNVIDRVRFGAVVDFLDFHVGNYHWPAFNLADSAIFMGVVVLCIKSMMHPHK